MSGSTLVVSFKLLGDLIVQTSAFRSLKARDPTEKLSLLVDQSFQEVFWGNADVDDVLAYPLRAYKQASLLRKIFILVPFLIKIRNKKFSKVILMDRSSLGCLVAFFSGARHRVGLKNQTFSFLLNFPMKKKEGTQDYIDFYFYMMQFNLFDIYYNRQTYLFPDKVNVDAIHKNHPEFFKKDNVIAIHLGASRQDKMWPIKCHAELLKKMVNTFLEHSFVVMCGPGERHFLEQISSLLVDIKGSTRILLVDVINFKDLVAFSSLSTFFVTHDSAPRHVAMALKKTCLVLMNQWNLKNWGLYSQEQGQWVLSPLREVENVYNIDEITVDTAFLKIQDILSVSQELRRSGFE